MISFLEGKLYKEDLYSGEEWKVFDNKENWEVRKGSSNILLRKRSSYPITFCFENNNSYLLGYVPPSFFNEVREKFVGGAGSVNSIVSYLRKDLSTEFLLIYIDSRNSKLRVYRDALCTIPVFYLQGKDFISFSNRFQQLTSLVGDNVEVDFQGLYEFLLGLEGNNRTMLRDIELLGERSVLVFSTGGISVELPDSAVPAPCEKDFDKPLRVFGDKLEDILFRYWERIPDDTFKAIELSAGIDSSTLAGFYSKLSNEVMYALTMVLPDDLGDSQIRKIKDLHSSFGMESILSHIGDKFPLSSELRSSKLVPFYETREIYYEALNSQAEKAKNAGVQVIFTGMGGDELFIIDPREPIGHQGSEEVKYRKQLDLPGFFTKRFKELMLANLPEKKETPLPVAPYSVLGSNASRNNIYVNHGIWPVAPLGDPYLAAFCRSFPIEYRRAKKILRDYHKSKSYPESVYNPEINEDFGGFFEYAMKYHLRSFLMKLFENSVLAGDLGLIDKDLLVRDYNKFCSSSSGDGGINPLYFYEVAVSEINLQSLKRQE